MDRELSDEEVDCIAKNLLNELALNDDALDEIAGSPRLWWSVRTRIEAEKTRREKSWFFAFRSQILAFGTLAIVLCFGLATLFLNLQGDSIQQIAKENSVQNSPEEKAETPERLAFTRSNGDSDKRQISTKSELNPIPEKITVKNTVPKAKFVANNQNIESSAKQLSKSPRKESLPKTATEETKTDFIALSYAANTDSGQIVRVKVPSSMMVSLGLATHVEKESELVSAEVVIGDDGLARAIRFIR